jgi:hypothetical protein
LFDVIRTDNKLRSKEDMHGLNVFMTRLLFCFFAEDTGIFEKTQFSLGVKSHTKEDGSDLAAYIKRVFEVLSTKGRTGLPDYLARYPYVNGGLFDGRIPIPKFSPTSRKLLVESGIGLDWSEINPDIFGSMFQAISNPATREGLGMHYTSVANITKVIGPLFLDRLYDEMERAAGNPAQLLKLLGRIERIKVFDPACGSGNFLIIAYKEIRKLEMEIFKQYQEATRQLEIPVSRIALSQFYGIEIDDFAHEIAGLSLWLAVIQMDLAFKDEFGKIQPRLPLSAGGNIALGNAAELDWDRVCPYRKGDEVYLLGNPPYRGARLQSAEQKADVARVFGSAKGANDLDYVSAWFIKGVQYLEKKNAELAFVSTNSIVQGNQTGVLWPILLARPVEIGFAYQAFKWTNFAKGNAGVACVIIGMRNPSSEEKFIISDEQRVAVRSINPYLVDGPNITVSDSKRQLFGLPASAFGNMANDGGHLFLDRDEMERIIRSSPAAVKFIRKAVGAAEFIDGIERWCIWVEDDQIGAVKKIPALWDRIRRVQKCRADSSRAATAKLAKTPHRFGEIRHQDGGAIIIPCHSSEQRDYIPIGFLSDGEIILNSALAVFGGTPFLFGLLTSKMHMVWVRAVGGRLEMRLRYSAGICYNPFPVPKIDAATQAQIAQRALAIMAVRESFPGRTLSDLYDSDNMPRELREAHAGLDQAVERCYSTKEFPSDRHRLEHLLNLYAAKVSGNA